MIQAYLNRLVVAVPEHEVHGTFVRFAERRDPRAAFSGFTEDGIS